jgi:PadR family transcriptional regulator, regulatory protein AphA
VDYAGGMVAGTRVATGTLTTTEAAVLALLALEGERSGYDLLKHVGKAIGYIWAPARSQLYALLPRLVTDGLAHGRTVTQADRPDKTLYRISKDGRRALDGWLETVDPSDRDAFHLRLFVGKLTTHDVLIRHVEAYRERMVEWLEELRAVDQTNTRRDADYYHYFLLRYGLQHAELQIEWCDWVLRSLRRRS